MLCGLLREGPAEEGEGMSLVGVGVKGGETRGKNITEEACGGNRRALQGSTDGTGTSCPQAPEVTGQTTWASCALVRRDLSQVPLGAAGPVGGKGRSWRTREESHVESWAWPGR